MEENYKIINAPERIFIQVGEFEGDNIDFKELDEEQCTFSTGTVFNNDLEYVSISERDKFAMEFAEWILKNGFDTGSDKWFDLDGDGSFCSTKQLLDLFKQAKEGKG